MAEIRLHISQERLDSLTVDEQIALEEWSDGQASTRQIKSVVARFVVDENTKYMSEARALKVLGRLSLSEFGRVIGEFTRLIGNDAVNPTNGGD